MLEGLYDALSARPTLSRSTVIVTNSLRYAEESRMLPPFAPRIRAIHQGVDSRHTRSIDGGASFREEFTNGRGSLVTFLGRLVPYKGVQVLIEAATRLRQEDITFAIGGKGPLRERLTEEVRRRGLGESVRFLGFVPDEEIGNLLHASDLVVCPSISLAESTPIVLLEALACGTPTIGTRLGGSEETLPDDGTRGRLVPPHDPDALAAAIRTLLETSPWTPNRTPLLTRTWDDVATDYLRLYEEVLSLGDLPDSVNRRIMRW
jgi:glycosyltransferase involved in cell wall biosynthesis